MAFFLLPKHCTVDRLHGVTTEKPILLKYIAMRTQNAAILPYCYSFDPELGIPSLSMNNLKTLYCHLYLYSQATTLNCTHTFCHYCIVQWMKKKNTCPICRKCIRSQNKSIVVDNFIDKMVENLSMELKNRRQEIVEERQSMYVIWAWLCC